MAAPSIQWYRHTSAGDAGTTIDSLAFGTVTAGTEAPISVVSFIPSTNAVDNAKFWLYDSVAVLSGGGNVSLGNTTRKWWFFADKATSLSAGMFSKTATSLGGPTLACDYWPSNNSAGAGISLGTVTVSTTSDYVFISPQPSSLAYDGTYTDFAFQLSYDFS